MDGSGARTIDRVLHAIAVPILRRQVRTSRHSWRHLERPPGPPRVEIAGPNPDRIVLLGAGPAVGYGASTHDSALAGQLARRIAPLTGRGLGLDILADPDMLAPQARVALDGIDQLRLDAVVITVGSLEALILMPVPVWRAHIDGLLDSAADVPVFVVAIPPLETIITMLPIYRTLVARRCAEMNQATRDALEGRSRATWVEFVPPPGTLPDLVQRRAYADWADLLAPRIAAALEV